MAQKMYLLSKDGLDLKNPEHQYLLNFVLDSQNAWSEIQNLNNLTKKDKNICKSMLLDIREMLNLLVTFPNQKGINNISFKMKYFNQIMASNVTELSEAVQGLSIEILKGRLK